MRLIDADYLKNLPFERLIHTDFGDTAIPIEEIDNAPTVEQEVYITGTDYDLYMRGYNQAREDFERPQGKWYHSCQYGWHCSLCHETVKDMPTIMRKATFNFCPNCGADMRGKEEC